MLDRMLEARRTHKKVPLPSPPIPLDAAYRVQDQLREALVVGGARVIGWKAGLTGRAAQEATGIHHPVAGFLLGDGVYATGETVPLSRFAELVVEAEVAFVMKKDLAGPGVTAAGALLAVEGALPALELPDLRWDGSPTGGDLVADGVAGNAIVLGQPLTPVVGLDLALEGLVYEMSGRVMATATAAEVLGNPLNSLA
jgi:2-keto-4-pentenoate hydratase